MGNTFCKNFDSSNSQDCTNRLCPTGNSKNTTHVWKKKVLANPATMNQKLEIEHPVPAPRKKKCLRAYSADDVNVILSEKMAYVPNGFKDVFGCTSTSNFKGNRTLVDDIDFNRKNIHLKNQNETTYRNGNLRVGNKKSDKFFGESLSDSLSDVVFDPTNEISRMQVRKHNSFEEFVQKNLPQLSCEEAAHIYNKTISNINNELEHLPNIPSNKTLIYQERKPVQVFLLAPRRSRKPKPASNETLAPKKPLRDLVLYRKGLEINKAESDSLNYIPLKEPEMSTSDQNNTNTFNMGSENENILNAPKHLNQILPISSSESSKVLQKSASSHSFFTNELMRSLANRVCKIGDYSIEDICQISDHIDGSMAVSQNIQKLKTRKTSHLRKIDSCEKKNHFEHLNGINTFEEPLNNQNFVLIKIDVTNESEEKKDSQNNKSISLNETKDLSKNVTKEAIKMVDVVNKYKRDKSSSSDILSEFFQNERDIIFAFKKFLEEELNNCDRTPKQKYAEDVVLEEGVRQAIERMELELAEERSEMSTKCNPMVNKLEDFNENSIFCSEEQSVGESDLINKNLLHVHRLHLRRESIEDVDNWFTKHSDILEKDPTQTTSFDENKRITTNTVYDHIKLFPFGDIRQRHESMNDEFFDAKPSSPKVSKHNSISED